jgi:RimJ/RimL family protein N-acetyltransferase
MAMWATVLKPEGSYVGRCGLYPHLKGGERAPDEGVLAFYLARAFCGRGLATEAGRAFVDFGFGVLGLKRIVTTVDTRNAASVRVLEKLGFVVERFEEGPRSFYHFELLRPEKQVVRA